MANTFQRGTSATSDSRLFRTPTKKNPLITKTPGFQEETAQDQSLRTGGLVDPNSAIGRRVADALGQQTSLSNIARPELAQQAIQQADAFNINNRDTTGSAVTARLETEQSKIDTAAAQDTSAQQSRAFFNALQQSGVSQDELINLTGASNAQEARTLAQGEFANDLKDLQDKRGIASLKTQQDIDEAKARASVETAFKPQFAEAARQAGITRETALRIQGRAGAGSKSGEQQITLSERERLINDSIRAQQSLEQNRAAAIARGGSQDEIDSFNEQIGQRAQARAKLEQEAQLIQAGLDEAAIERAEFNTKTMLSALDKGFVYDPETDTFTASEGGQKIDQGISKLLGFASDQFGNQINGADGQPLQIDSDDGKEWGSFKDRFGNTVFFNKANPSEQQRSNQSKVFTQPDGSTSSSPTSNSSGVQALGGGESYTRDNGTEGLLGENCVKYARTIVPNLPFGLVTKENKANAIKFAEDEGFGSSDASGAQVGDAILTGEGSWGHAAVISGIDPETGEFILNEANYKSGQVTEGRRIAANDPMVLGFISSTAQPQMSSVINEQGTGEGQNSGVDTQVVVESTNIPKVDFSATRKNEFAKYEKDPAFIPKSVGNEAELEKFYNEYEVWKKQTNVVNPNLEGTELGSELDKAKGLGLTGPEALAFAKKRLEEKFGKLTEAQGKAFKSIKTADAEETNYQNVTANIDQEEFADSINVITRKISDPLAQLTGEFINRNIKDPNIRRAILSEMRWIAAVLREESGAAISAQEYTTKGAAFFPRAGDDAGTIADKERARRIEVEGLMGKIGPAGERRLKEDKANVPLKSLSKSFPGGFDLDAARNAGATDAEIREFLTK